ncbi:uncharacterized protein LOC121234585 isoform X1 [Juglans microcarpa x Juglans regia]|uniref:uncharacterized protein LOC121234585 isoform X1 n=1 Tax=Juglans microcarpa x Juglans regia TaxID=2249226 RepID=UPI001B7F65B7|nr:uncharacterized protein LOC121234585 isoform X1 [Juglans microcarpa x Juglans regia]XP_040986498.1 uncharacterized protein LOC121234585 isoform X1 [Juglans microcarpa x Juglans regia]XP_040986499.1 uncharacterized protein LOC121234585 isoform X1 [Juglans microcarpa x Juglans regia]XP_040986500.1 uncharacterized protein LOC121234585 isoform X1 [Juglans microcarpa x Juglans regia]
MDLKHKGITWVGNFFQKLEAVCQEVDDIVNKDTVKYVENQLQTMGGSVKKFCSDVVQDVLPPLVDPVKCQAQVVALKSNDAISTYLKAMMGDEENHVDVIKQSHVEPNADDHLMKQLPDTSSKLCLVNQNIPPTSVDCLEVEETVSSLQEIDDIMTDENPNVSAEENATEDSVTEVLELFSLNDKEPFGASFSCEFGESNHQNAFGVVAEVPPASSFHCVEFQSPPKMGTVTDCHEEVSQSVSDVSSMNTSSVSAFSVISDEKTIVEMKLVCSGSSLPVESCSLSGKSPDNSLYAASCDNHGDCICHSSSKLPSSAPAPVIPCKENADKLGHDSSSSILLSESIEEDTSSIKEIQESSGNRHIHFWESAQGPPYDLNNDINDSSMETVKLCDEVKLDESCVIVEPSELYAVSRRVRKLRSYRKKIQDAFASKKRLAEEYEQLAVWYGDVDMGSSKDSLQSIPAAPLDLKNLPIQQACDSDWEFL